MLHYKKKPEGVSNMSDNVRDSVVLALLQRAGYLNESATVDNRRAFNAALARFKKDVAETGIDLAGGPGHLELNSFKTAENLVAYFTVKMRGDVELHGDHFENRGNELYGEIKPLHPGWNEALGEKFWNRAKTAYVKEMAGNLKEAGYFHPDIDSKGDFESSFKQIKKQFELFAQDMKKLGFTIESDRNGLLGAMTDYARFKQQEGAEAAEKARVFYLFIGKRLSGWNGEVPDAIWNAVKQSNARSAAEEIKNSDMKLAVSNVQEVSPQAIANKSGQIERS